MTVPQDAKTGESLHPDNTLNLPGNQWYPPSLAGARTLCASLFSRPVLDGVEEVLHVLTPDAYGTFLLSFLRRGRERFGEAWRYADICTAVLALTGGLRARNYLEIGVRRGRSLAMAARANPGLRMVGFDLWQPGYAGMENPGPDFVTAEVRKVGFTGELTLISGDSRETVPAYFSGGGETHFDLVTVDGDHSPEGAEQDLANVLPHVRVGGAVILDDICHPQHRYLFPLWRRLVMDSGWYSTFEYVDLGYGVAFGVRLA